MKKQHKTRKKEVVHKLLSEFYTEEQKRREEVERIEQEIFEHLKHHTKKVLGENKK